MKHRLPHVLLEREVRVHMVGCGGNGSQMITGLARLSHALTALGHPGFRVSAWDPDEVSEANVARQLFSPADVGLNKATILVHRLNAWFGLRWNAWPARYGMRTMRAIDDYPDIVISCVDSRKSRAAIMHNMPGCVLYWMDLGNRAADGQVVLGTWRNDPLPGLVAQISTDGDDNVTNLPTANLIFPEIVDVDIPEDDTPSCGLAQALERQELFVNQSIVTPALEILWRLFRFGCIEWHGAFVNLARGSMRPLPVDLATWNRMGIGARPRKGAKRRREKSHA